MFDVIVIGGGAIGGAVLRELSRYDLDICLLEKENDVCMGQSKANSGIVHAGFDAKENTLKAKFNLLGNKKMKSYAEDLGVKYKNNGSLVVAFSDEDLITLNDLKKRGEKNGVEGLEIISAEELKNLEPNISSSAKGALLAMSGGIVCPYELTIAEIGNAMDNGAKLLTNFEAVKIEGEKGNFKVFSKSGETVEGKIVVNCSGLSGEKISSLVGDNTFKIGARRGEYILLDKTSGSFVNHTLFFTPTAKGKGILVSQTVDGNVILGPTAEEIQSGDTDTTQEGLSSVLEKAKIMTVNPPVYNAITSFSGVRAYSDRHDFIIEESKIKKGFINCVGIESPGLTSAPAIGEYVVSEIIGKILPLKEKANFISKRKPDYFFNNLSDAEKNDIIKKDGRYGKIVCRCEKITEGEIVRAIKENPPAKDIDAVKRRTRAGMGRCQGGFCQPYVAEILSRELGVSLEEVTKKGNNSELLTGRTK